MTSSSRLVIIAIVIGAFAPESRAQFGEPFRDYQWTISTSATDPYANVGPFIPGPTTVYLWFACHNPYTPPTAAAFFGLYNTNPANSLLQLSPLNGWSNAGSATEVVLYNNDCPYSPSLAATLTVFNQAPGQWCFRDFQGIQEIAPCGSAEGKPMAWTGLSQDGAPPCTEAECLFTHAICPMLFCGDKGGCFTIEYGCPNSCENCGDIGQVESCDECTVSIEPSTWGKVRALYR